MSSRPRRVSPQSGPRRSGLKLVEPTWTSRKGLLGIRSSNAAGHRTVSLEGELDLSNVALLEEEIRLAEASAETLTIDLRGLAFMDSSGLRAIQEAHHPARLAGRLRLLPGSRRVQSVFRLTGTEDALPFERPL
jgi:anti-sigma B factor antagonist